MRTELGEGIGPPKLMFQGTHVGGAGAGETQKADKNAPLGSEETPWRGRGCGWNNPPQGTPEVPGADLEIWGLHYPEASIASLETELGNGSRELSLHKPRAPTNKETWGTHLSS